MSRWLDRLDRHNGRPAVIEFGGENGQETSYERLARLSGRIAAGLRREGVEVGDRLALLAPSSRDWIALFVGVVRAGAVPVPLDVQADDESLRHMLEDSQPRRVFAGDEQSARLAELGDGLGLDICRIGDEDDDSWRRLVSAEESGAEDEAAKDWRPDETAVLFYTSGTTGPPKGVPLTHQNVATQIEVIIDSQIVGSEDRVLLPLPLHHVYPLVVGMLTSLAIGLPIVIPGSLTGGRLTEAMKEGAVTVVIGVPRLYQAFLEGVRGQIASSPFPLRWMLQAAVATSSWLRRKWGLQVGRALLFPLHRRIGPKLRLLASGGSALDQELAIDLESFGWQVAIGYGLTETSPLLTINPPGTQKLDTVGSVVEGTELRIDRQAAPDDGNGRGGGERAAEPRGEAAETQDHESAEPQREGKPATGEILARGPGVFHGYRHLPEKTDETFKGDWFRTGDLGFFDQDDHLHVVGRAGTMIITEGGEKVRPDDLEEAYAEHPAIRELGVLEDEGQVAALVVPEVSQAEADETRSRVEQAIADRGGELPSHQRLNRFELTQSSLPRTRLGKIRRHKLKERFREAARGEQRSRTPSLEEMSSGDRVLLEDHAARQVWDLLCEKYGERGVAPDANLRLDLAIDSFEWMNLSLEVRRVAGIELDEEAIAEIETVRDLLQRVAEAQPGGEEADAVSLEDPGALLSEGQRESLRPLHGIEWPSAWSIFITNRLGMKLLYRVEVEGLDRLPSPPAVIAANHASYLDPAALGVALSWKQLCRTYWGGWTGTMFANPVMRRLSRLTHVVPIDPQRAAISSLAFGAAVLDRGQFLVWFPEGQRSPDGTLQPFRPGIGRLAEGRRLTIVPTWIGGTYEALPRGAKFPRPGTIRIAFGEPLEFDAIDPDRSDQESYRQISDRVRSAVARLGDRE